MKFLEKVLISTKKTGVKKVIALLLVVTFVLSMIPMSVNASDEEPDIGGNENAAEYMTVINNDVDYTSSFRNTGEIEVSPNTRGSFDNIKYTGNVYYYSADIYIASDSSSYGSIRMVLGTCTYSAYKRYIEVCVRPNLNGQAVFFLDGNGLNESGEYAVSVAGSTGVKVGDTYHCTAKYDNGTLSFWVNGNLVFDSVALPNKTRKIAPSAGFYSQNCEGKISNVKLWGDLEKIEDITIDDTVKPVFDENKDVNSIVNVLVTDTKNNQTYKCTNGEVKSEIQDTNRPLFSNIVFGKNTYNLSFDAVKYDTEGKDWDGLIFKVATAKKDGKDYDVELRIRSGAAILFVRDKNNGETPLQIVGCSSPFGVTNSYAIIYKEDGKIYLWKDDTALFLGYDLSKQGYTDISPSISLGGEVCAFAYTNIKLWGDGLNVKFEPEFDGNTDTNVIPDLDLAEYKNGTIFDSENCLIKNDADTTTRLNFEGLTYDKVYNFSTKSILKDNKNLTGGGTEFNWEGLIFSIGNAKKNSEDYKIEIRVRSGGIHIFSVKDGGEEVVESFNGIPTAFGEEVKYTVVFKNDGTFDLWRNGASVIYGYNLTEKGFENLTPELGLGGEVCSFEFTDMKLWGEGLKVTPKVVKIEPQFNKDTDTNVIPELTLSQNKNGTVFDQENCSIRNDADTTTRLSFDGITYGKVYNFTTKAILKDNKNLTAAETEIDWEGLIFAIGKAKKGSDDYTLEVRVRNGGIHLFAVKDGGEELVESFHGVPTAFGAEIKYTVVFRENGTFDFWHNGTPIMYGYDVTTKGFENLIPEFGLGGEVCSFEFLEMRLWGKGLKVTPQVVKVEPQFNNKTDINVILKSALAGNSYGTDFSAKSCFIKNNANTTTRLSFAGITYGKSYNFSTKAILKDNKNLTGGGTEFNWEGLIFSVGNTKKGKDNYRLEIRVRSGAIHIFAVKEGGEELVKSFDGIPTPFGKEIKYTLVFKENGTFDFWHNGSIAIEGFDVTKKGFTALTPELRLGGEVCSFEFTEMKFWGNGLKVTPQVVKVEPQFNNRTDINVILKSALAGNTYGTDFSAKSCFIKNNANTTTRLSFAGITYGKAYNFSTKAILKDNKNLTGAGTEFNWEGLIFSVGNTKKGKDNYRIEIRVRSGAVHIFAVKEGGEELLETFGGIPTSFGKEVKCTVVFTEKGTIDFWHNGTLAINGFNITKKGFTALTPELRLGGEVCSFEFNEMKFWGKGLKVTPQKVIVEPQFNKDTDVNIIPNVVISNGLTGTSTRYKNCAVSSNANVTLRLALSGITYGKSYNFSTKAIFEDNKNLTGAGKEFDWEGLIFAVGNAKKGNDSYRLEIRVRSGAVHIFAVKEGGEELLESLHGIPTPFGEEIKYTVVFKENGTFDFWHNGAMVINGFDITKKGFTGITPELSLGGEVTSFKFTDMKLWGDVIVETAPKFDSKTMEDLIPSVVVNDIFKGKLYKLTDRVLKNTTESTGRINFAGIKVVGDYIFFADVSFSDNKNILPSKQEINWEGIIFRAAKAEKDNKSYFIEVRVRKNNLLIYAVDEDGKETLLSNQSLVTPYGKAQPYVLEYKSGEITLWRDDIKILNAFRPAGFGFKNISAFMGIGGEVCNFSFDNMHLVNKFAKHDRKIPEKIASNGDYGTITEVSENSVISFNNNVLKCKSDKGGERVFFQYLPFDVNDTYVFGCDVTVEKADQPWMGPRFIFGKNSKGEEIALFFTAGNLLVVEGSKTIYSLNFKRELGETYRFDMLIEPTSITVWVNEILLIDGVRTSPKSEAMTGILFENAVATVKNINMYYTTPVDFVIPKKKPKPVLKYIEPNQYNAAEFAKVTLNDKDFNGYFDCKLSSNNNKNGLRYMFKDLPIGDDQSYYYSSTFNVSLSEENWKGPRYIYRKGANVTMYCAITQTSILLLADGAVVASSPFELKIGQSYNIVIYSTPDTVSVWVDDNIVFSNIDLSKYSAKDTLKATPGILFELCKADVTNIAIYGDDIEFDPDFVDLELYNDKFFRMKGVPQNSNSSKNLFSNIIMNDLSSGSLGAAYNDEEKVFKNDYSDVESGKIQFVDAKYSSNLNGLKNSSGYVFNFKYKVNKLNSDKPEKNGVWFICNSATAPYLTTACETKIGFFEDSLRLHIYKDGLVASSTETEFKFGEGKEYDINVVHGKNWIKLFVDGNLLLVSTDLPEYKVAFDFEICNTSCDMSGFELYEFEDSGLEILETIEPEIAVKAGKTVINSKSYNIEADKEFPLIAVIVLAVLMIASIFGGIVIIINRKRYLLK